MTASTRSSATARGTALAIFFIVGALLSASLFASCGSDGGSSNGGLCEQCGNDPDGPCQPEIFIGIDSPHLGTLCPGDPDGCPVDLMCLRKADSAQRRCYPFSTDRTFECDGEPAQGPTATPQATATASSTLTPVATSTGPTATGLTPTPASTPTTRTVTFDVFTDDEDLEDLPAMTITATYPASKGSMQANTCADPDGEVGVTASDNGSGTLTITVGATPEVTSFLVECDFSQVAGANLVDGDIAATASDSRFEVTPEVE